MVILVCFSLLFIVLVSERASASDIQIQGTYRDLWNKTLDKTVTYDGIIAVDDISCDGKPDVVLITQNDSVVTLVALCGKNGTQLWTYNITGFLPSVDVYPVDDMTCDGKTDFIVTVRVYEFFAYKTTVFGLGGKNGTFLWDETR